MKYFFKKNIKDNEIKNEIKLKNGKKKLNKNTEYIEQININMIFSNMKWQDVLVKVFMLVRLI